MAHRVTVHSFRQSTLIFTNLTTGSSSASVYLYLFTSNQLPCLVFPKHSLVWVGLVNVTFSLPALIMSFTVVIINILKCDLKCILKAVEGKALKGN